MSRRRSTAPAPMLRRVAAAQSAVDAYLDKPFAWGVRDCARLAAHVLQRLGRKPGLSRGGTYRNALGAKRALKRAGYDSLAAALDALKLPRIPYAFALPGDVVELRAREGEEALGIVLGNGRVLAFAGAVEGLCLVCEPPAAEILNVWSAL